MTSLDPEHQNSGHDYSKEFMGKFPVYPLIRTIRKDVEMNFDTALTWSQLSSPEVNFTVIRPLLFKYAALQNPAIIYVLLIVRSHFQSLADDDLAYAPIIATRADACELIAIKLLREFTNSQLELAAVLTTAWNPLQGAPADVVEIVKVDLGREQDDLDDPMNALEVAISTESKKFCSSPLVQTMMNNIWQGHIVFSSTSSHALVQDDYKTREIEFYDHRKAPFLDHYRLRVPRYRSIVDSVNFLILFIVFSMCLSTKQFDQMIWTEVIFIVFMFGFMLDEFAATQEHGWSFYIANMWNGFDLAFIVIFLLYLGLRIHGLSSHDIGYSDLAFDILSCGACVLLPRLAFLPVSNTVVILALRGMIMDFIYFITLAAICFSGLLFTLHSLAGEKWPVKDIAWLMVQIWFGNTYLSFVQATSFHPIFGPILMTCFAALSNTLLITMLMSILSATFARINENATEEFLFQFTISTLEGVKSDAVLAYQPPFNLAAYAILTVLSFVLSPRTLHTVNVFMLRITSFPVLVAIGIYERYMAPGHPTSQSRGMELITSGTGAAMSLWKNVSRMSIIDAFTGSNSKELLGAVLRVEVDLDDHAIALHDQDVEDGEILALPGKGDDKGGDDPFTDGAANGEHGEQDAMAEEGGQEEEGDEREAGETTDLLPQHSSGSVRSRGRRLRRPTVDTQLASTAAGAAAPGLTVAPATSVEEAEADEVLTALPSGAPVLPVGAPLARGRYVSMPSSRSAPVHGLGSALPRTPTRPGQRYRSRDRSQVGGLRGLAEESNVNGGSVAGAGAGGYGFGLVGGASPLARTFSRTVHGAPANDGALVAVLKRLEGAVAGLSASAPASTTAAVAGAGAKGNGEKRKADTDTEKEVAELRKEMKDVTERQARIEELLMSLTRQMRS